MCHKVNIKTENFGDINIFLFLQSVSQELPDSPEDILKDMPARRFFNSRSKSIGKTGSQTVQDKHNASYTKSKN